MRMRLKWLPQAITILDKIYDFHALNSKNTAIRLYNRLVDETEILRTFPQAGPIEPLLAGYTECFRYLVIARKYKIIYTITDDLIEIHAVWDCRQEESRLKNRFR